MSARAETDREATQSFTVLDVLIEFTGRQLTPDLIDEIQDKLNTAMREGPCAWAFKDS